MQAMKFYTTLKEEREKQNLSLAKLAIQFSVTGETMRKIERGYSAPNVFLAMEIAEYFGKTVDKMFWRI